ncbi:hypothetical protein [Candidatus Shikimatogenerans silvanidophilus]|uniref:hypothetical protein n=1 Tax=Candidatus Shikimatogenerans silvanidophilus TaxID=2782547 RepID=UPI001F5239BC|nr:hypothetical protein [Candidatus Shikimatogenerans silvanidophilus]
MKNFLIFIKKSEKRINKINDLLKNININNNKYKYIKLYSEYKKLKKIIDLYNLYKKKK